MNGQSTKETAEWFPLIALEVDGIKEMPTTRKGKCLRYAYTETAQNVYTLQKKNTCIYIVLLYFL